MDPAARVWLEWFDRAPDAALDDLLLGKVWLGSYAAADVAQALPQFFPVNAVDALDSALQRWLAAQYQQTQLPGGVTPKQYAQALVDAFGLMQVLPVSRSQGWCREHVSSFWAWLQVQPSFPSREPRVAFLRALALHQPNRDLLGFWMSLCRQAHQAWVQLALFGLRRMPADDEGTAEASLPAALIHGLLDYGQTLARAQADAGKKKAWLSELDFLSAVYPMSRERWQARFREAMASRSQNGLKPVRHWLDERYPAANQSASAHVGRKPLVAPHWDNEIQPLLVRFDQQRAQVSAPLKALMDQHLLYARRSGDSYFLVRTNSRLAEFLLDSPYSLPGAPRDAQWAAELAQVAVTWAPGEARAWSVVARALDAQGDWPRAKAVFWYARRRFPYNPQAHNQLGHALALRGQVDESEAVYWAAIQRFPDNAVCWADLGNTLKVSGRKEESLAVYMKAKQRFHRDPSILNALVGVLIDLGRADEASGALAQAEEISAGNTKDQRILNDLRRRLMELVAGRPLPSKQLHPRTQVPAGDWAVLSNAAGTGLQGLDALGEATLWRQRGMMGDFQLAADALSKAAVPLRQDTRWIAEQGLLLAADSGLDAGRDYFDQMAGQRPGDAVLAALRLRAHGQCGEAVDWQALRGRFEELAPLIRVAQDPGAKWPADLAAAVKAVTQPDGEVQLDEMDDELRQALRVYDTAEQPDLADLVQQDFLAARQLSVF